MKSYHQGLDGPVGQIFYLLRSFPSGSIVYSVFISINGKWEIRCAKCY